MMTAEKNNVERTRFCDICSNPVIKDAIIFDLRSDTTPTHTISICEKCYKENPKLVRTC